MSLCLQNIGVGGGLYGSLFLAGLAGGFSHCVPMCGPFVLAQIDSDSSVRTLSRLKGALLLPYHLGRITTYTAMAAAFSAAFHTTFLFSQTKSIVAALMLLTAAVIFLANAIPLVGRVFPYLANIRIPAPQRLIARLSQPVSGKADPLSRYLLGLLLGFMPCGMVVAALMAATSLETPVQAATGMALFGLGTIPALFLAASGGQMLATRFPQTLPKIRVAMILLSSGTLLLASGKMILP